MSGSIDYENLASILHATGKYRVLRKLMPRTLIENRDSSQVYVGLFLDVETTGLDASREEIIELALVPFTFGSSGKIFEIMPPYQSFRQPSKPISPEITAITGITDAMVAGHSIDLRHLESIVNTAGLVISHNASFDRKFVERLSGSFIHKPWACSMSQVNWKAEGYEGAKLDYLALSSGFFYDRHRALNDCFAAIELLAITLPKSQERAMAQLLSQSSRSSWRIWAQGAHYDLRHILKARGYRWNNDRRTWYVDVPEELYQKELAFLQKEIFQRQVDVPATHITAYERFSVRS